MLVSDVESIFTSSMYAVCPQVRFMHVHAMLRSTHIHTYRHTHRHTFTDTHIYTHTYTDTHIHPQACT